MSRRLLVVEDDAITRFMMTEMCDELGYDCETVANGQACIDRLSADPQRFGAILMDIHMPRLSGLDASARIRDAATDLAKGLPILAVTADEHWHNERRCRDAGFDGVIPKPVTLGGLHEALRKIFPDA